MSASLWDRVWAKVPDADRDLLDAWRNNTFDFLSFYDTRPLSRACWTWRGALSKKRRGQRRPHIKRGAPEPGTLLVARQVCEWFNGPPPGPDYEAGHTCPDGENCLCVNPFHLAWMTRTQNEQYKQALRRQKEQCYDHASLG